MPNPIPFPANVPLVGQRIRTAGYTILPLLECLCHEPSQMLQPVILYRGGQWGVIPVTCPTCHAVYTFQALRMEPDGQLAFAFKTDVPQQAS